MAQLMPRRLAAIGLLTLALVASGWWLIRGDDPAGSIAEARRDIASHDLRDARKALISATRANPGSVEAQLLLAQVALDLFDAVTAQSALDRAVQAGAKQEDVAHLYGQALWMQGENDRAVDALSTPTIPRRYQAYAARILGRVEMDRGNMDDAKQAFEQAISLAPDDSLLWTDVARYRFATGDQKGAIEAVDHAVALDNQNVRALEFRGRLMRSQFGLTAALPWFERGLQIAPDDVPLLEEYAATLGEARRYTDMLKTVRRILALDAHNGRAYYMQAVIAARARDYDLANRILPRAGSNYLELPGPMLLDAVIQYELGNYNRAIDKLDQLLALQPRNDEVRILLARAMARSGDNYGALDTIRPIAERPDAENYAQMLAARAFEATGQRDKAAIALDAAAVPAIKAIQITPDIVSLAVSERAVRDDPDNARTVIPYVRNLLQAKQADAAFVEARKLQTNNPGVAAAHMLVGDVEIDRGNIAAAIEAYGQARNIAFSEPVMLRLVDAMRRVGNSGGAREVLGDYLKLNPTSHVAQKLKAYDFLDNAQWAEAIPLLRQIKARIGVNDPVLLANLARAYSGAGQNRAAIVEAALAYRIAPANPMVVHVYGQVLLKAGNQPKAARELLQKAALLSPDDKDIAAEYVRADAAWKNRKIKP